MRRIVDICKQTGKRFKIVPAINEIIDNKLSQILFAMFRIQIIN